MIHTDNDWNLSLQQAWLRALLRTGKVTTADWDVFRFSFYPFYSTDATLEDLENTWNALASTYDKPLHMVEPDWPDLCPDVDVLDGTGISEPEIPLSVTRQIEWVQGVINVVRRVPLGLGKGVWYWEPAFLNNTSLGSGCSDVILFDVDWSEWPDSIAGYSRHSANILGT